jgi:hypothetical protein
MTWFRSLLFPLIAVLLLLPAISSPSEYAALAATAPTGSGNVLVFPQLVAGGIYISYIHLVNVNNSATVTGTLSVYNQDGSPRAIAIDGKPTNSQFSVTIPPGGNVVLSTSASPNITVGMAKFVSDFPAGGVIRFVSSDGQVGVLSSLPENVQTVPLVTNNGNDLGLAISNPGATPINITLAYLDRAGAIVQTIDPPQLNPLAPNGQVSKFVGEYGLTQAANRSDGTVLIFATTPGGSFSALALLMNGAKQLSTTAVIDGAAPGDSPRQFQGSYTGTWNNTTFATNGTIALSMGLVESTRSMLVRITITGNIFGGSPPPPFLFYSAYDLSAKNTVNASGSDPLLGNYTFTVDNNLKFTFTSTGIANPNVSGFTATGDFHSDRIRGTYTVNLKPSGTAAGNFEIDHTNN